MTSSNLRVVEPFRMHGHVLAEVFVSKIGLPPALAMQFDTEDGGEASVTLTAREAHELMLWLQFALGLPDWIRQQAETERLRGIVSYMVQQLDQIVGDENGKPPEALARSVVKMYDRLMRHLAMSDAAYVQLREALERIGNEWADSESYQLGLIANRALGRPGQQPSNATTVHPDTERLNYIEQNFHGLGFTLGDTWMTLNYYKNDPGFRRFGSLREAVDAVRLSRRASETPVEETGTSQRLVDDRISAWHAVWDQLLKHNPKFASGRYCGGESALREIRRLQEQDRGF